MARDEIGDGAQDLPGLGLAFAAMVAPQLKTPTPIAVAIAAGSVAWLAHELPYKLGLILATLIGVLVGIVLDFYNRQQDSSS